MKKRISNGIGLILFSSCILLLTQVVQADIFIKQKRHSDAMKIMGQEQPAEDVIEEVWVTDEGFRSDNPKNSIIVKLDDKTITMIDHEKKSYSEMPMDMNKMMPQTEAGKKDAEDMAAFQNMMKNMMKIDISVQPMSDTKKIKNWMCKKYLMTMNTFMGAFTSEIWATEDLKIDANLYSKFASSMMAAIPGMQSNLEAMTTEMKKIKGVQVHTIMTQNIMNQEHKIITELLEFKEAKAPADLFKLPAGYKKQNMMK